MYNIYKNKSYNIYIYTLHLKNFYNLFDKNYILFLSKYLITNILH